MRRFYLRFLLKLLRRKPAKKPLVEAKSHAVRDRVRSAIEPLEGRIAPAALLNARTLAFVDADGDLVKVRFSDDVFDLNAPTLLAKANAVFKFSTGDVHLGPLNADDLAQRQQLQLLDLTVAPLVAAGLSFTVIADPQVNNGTSSGDGHASVGAIKATGHALGTVTIDGDLGQIDCGVGTSKIGLRALDVVSIGKFGTTTQKSSPAPDLESDISGVIKSVQIAGDMRGFLNVADARSIVNGRSVLSGHGTINTLVIGGSLIGNAAVEAASNNTGRISAYSIGSVQIGTDSADGIVGGGGSNAGAITVANKIGSVVVSGDVAGGAGSGSGLILATGKIGPVKILGDLTGGGGGASGSIRAGELGAVKIGTASSPGNVAGGGGNNSGLIYSDGKMGAVKIFGSVTGNAAHSGGIFATGALKSVSVGGSLIGGGTAGSGAIEGAGVIGTVSIGVSVVGGAGAGSGSIISGGNLASVTVLGNLDGGTGENSGAILAGHNPKLPGGDLGEAVIGGVLIGDEGPSSGAIVAGRNIGTVTIGEQVVGQVAVVRGGGGSLSASIYAGGSIGSVTLSHGITGGVGAGSASIQAHGSIGKVNVLAGNVLGGSGPESGSILAHEVLDSAVPRRGDIGLVKIAGELRGTGDRSGLIEAEGTLGSARLGALTGGNGMQAGAIVSGSGFLSSRATTAITVVGAIQGGSVVINDRLGNFTAGAMNGGALHVGEDIGSIVINGNVASSTVTALGQQNPGSTTDLAIASIQISGNVSGSQILAGYNVVGAAVNPDAQIGTVAVTGSWAASTLAAGTAAGNDGLFGTADDRVIAEANTAEIVSRIANVQISGPVSGTASAGDNFGFIAERINKFSANGSALALTGSPGQTFELGANGDVTVREVVGIV